MRTLLAVSLLALCLVGCAPNPAAVGGQTGVASGDATPKSEPAPQATETTMDKPTPKDGEEVAVLDTAYGKIVFQFLEDKAPGHVKNFKDLAKKGFYDGTYFHRVIPGFMIQGGDPNTKDEDRRNDGTGGPGYKIAAEFNDTKHQRGVVSMARTADPNSAGSQFFICVGDVPHLDNQYTAFGRVVEGMEAVDKIVNLPRDSRDNPNKDVQATVKSVKIEKWPLKAE